MNKFFYATCLFTFAIFASAQSVSLGAIRWDAWTGSQNSVGVQVERTLGPAEFHYRVPFFGVDTSATSVTIDGTTQAIMDMEIAYANYAGLNYWAFLWYSSNSGLDQARKLYKSSSKKALIDYCLVVEAGRFTNEIKLDDLVQDFKDASYTKVASSRPLLYLLGSNGISRARIDSLRNMAQTAGVGDPYIVLMRVGGESMSILSDLNLDAFSMYAVSWLTNGVPYANLATTEVGQWDWIGKSNKKQFVPHVTAGWDKRTRHLNAVTWEPDPGANAWVQMPTPGELANHIVEAMNWVMQNPEVSAASTVLIYAWNEHDEGGWLCPTLSKYEGTARIEALRNVLGLPNISVPMSIAKQGDSVSPIWDLLRRYDLQGRLKM